MKRKHMIVTGIAAVVLLMATAGASAYIATEMNDDVPVMEKVARIGDDIKWNDKPAQTPPPQKVAQNECDDANVVGAAIGAVAGGFAGNQVGSGRGQDLATVGGAIGGGYLGQQYIPTRNVLCGNK